MGHQLPPGQLPRRCQEPKHFGLDRRTALPRLSLPKRLLRRDRQGADLLRPLRGLRFQGPRRFQVPALRQEAEVLLPLRTELAQERKLPGTAAKVCNGLQQRAQRLVQPVPAGAVRRKNIAPLAPHPDAGGQDGPDRVVKRAEAALPQEGRQPEHPLVQQRLLVQQTDDGLEARLIPLLHGEDHGLGQAVAPAEGHRHPLAGPRREVLRQAVGIGLIDGVDRRLHRCLGQHRNTPLIRGKA